MQLAEANALAAPLRAENVKLTAEGRLLAPRNRASPASRRGPATPQSQPNSKYNERLDRARRKGGAARARSRRARRRRR